MINLTWYSRHGAAGAQGIGRRRGDAAADAGSAIPAAGDVRRQRSSHESRRYRDETEGRPPRLRIRSLRAYWTTWRVIWSYLWLRFRARFHSDAWIEHNLRQTNLRNARRIERTIIDLQGLFIKVGQLISIMTNFLPEEFRRELEGLQDAVPPRPYGDIEARIREELGKSPAGAVRAHRAPADRVGLDRPGPHREAARRQQGRGQSSVSRYRRDRPPRPQHAAPHLPDRRVVHPVPGTRGAVSRDPRDRDGGARLPRRGRRTPQRIAANFEGRTDVGVPARRRRAVDHARARRRTSSRA